jgi:hypothetical protein
MNSSSRISMKYFSDFYISYQRRIEQGPKRPVSNPPSVYFDRRLTLKNVAEVRA